MDRQCETRPCRERHELDNGPRYYMGQREVETSSKNLIVGEHLAREKKNKTKTKQKQLSQYIY